MKYVVYPLNRFPPSMLTTSNRFGSNDKSNCAPAIGNPGFIVIFTVNSSPAFIVWFIGSTATIVCGI